MITQQIIIQNKLGLHTRAAAKLVDIAKKYASKIEFNFRDRIVDCKSIMGLITLGAQKNHLIDLRIDGEDEQKALDHILKLINNKFDEE